MNKCISIDPTVYIIYNKLSQVKREKINKDNTYMYNSTIRTKEKLID